MKQSVKYLLFCLVGIPLIGLFSIPLIELCYSLFQDFFRMVFGRIVSWSGNDGFFAFSIIGFAPVSLFFYLRREPIKWKRIIYANVLLLFYLLCAVLLTGTIQLIWFKEMLKSFDDVSFNHLRYSAPSPFKLYWTLSMFIHLIIGNITVARVYFQLKRKEERLIDNE